MNSIDYVKSLKAVVTRSEAADTQTTVITDLTSKTVPIVSTAAMSFKTGKFKAKESIRLEEQYKEALRTRANLFTDLQERLERVRQNLDFINQTTMKIMPSQVAKTEMTYRVATLLQMTDNAAFLMRYARRLVEAVVVYETAQTGTYDKDWLQDNLSKGEIGWLDSKMSSFFVVLQALSQQPAEFKKNFEKIPDVVVDIDSGVLDAVFSRIQLDPFRTGFIPVWLNPAFYALKWIAEWEVANYKEAQDDLIRINKRILLLEELNSGKGNPKLEAEIEEYRKKASALAYKIKKFEDSL